MFTKETTKQWLDQRNMSYEILRKRRKDFEEERGVRCPTQEKMDRGHLFGNYVAGPLCQSVSTRIRWDGLILSSRRGRVIGDSDKASQAWEVFSISKFHINQETCT